MSRLATITWGSDQFRVGPWHGDAQVAYVAVGVGAAVPTTDGVRGVLARVTGAGYRRAMTSALRPHEARPFLEAGFRERERLIVLRRDVRDSDAPSPEGERRARRSDREAVLEVDHAAFEPTWQLDGAGLDEALGATPRVRFRVAEDETGSVASYVICGRAGRAGYLQRLAVHPRAQGRGMARTLITSSLSWLQRRGAHDIIVNTQTTNERAIDLYRSTGFEPDRSELIVLEIDL